MKIIQTLNGITEYVWFNPITISASGFLYSFENKECFLDYTRRNFRAYVTNPDNEVLINGDDDFFRINNNGLKEIVENVTHKRKSPIYIKEIKRNIYQSKNNIKFDIKDEYGFVTDSKEYSFFRKREGREVVVVFDENFEKVFESKFQGIMSVIIDGKLIRYSDDDCLLSSIDINNLAEKVELNDFPKDQLTDALKVVYRFENIYWLTVSGFLVKYDGQNFTFLQKEKLIRYFLKSEKYAYAIFKDDPSLYVLDDNAEIIKTINIPMKDGYELMFLGGGEGKNFVSIMKNGSASQQYVAIWHDDEIKNDEMKFDYEEEQFKLDTSKVENGVEAIISIDGELPFTTLVLHAFSGVDAVIEKYSENGIVFNNPGYVFPEMLKLFTGKIRILIEGGQFNELQLEQLELLRTKRQDHWRTRGAYGVATGELVSINVEFV